MLDGVPMHAEEARAETVTFSEQYPGSTKETVTLLSKAIKTFKIQ
jgi:hypothetical protein